MPQDIRLTFHVATILLVVASSPAAIAQDHGMHRAPYAGLQDREVTSLSEKDLDEIRQGAGWGLALPAELNGWPGPTHLLELATELELTEAQVDEIGKVKSKMQNAAIAAGERFIAAEESLDAAFASGEVDASSLRSKINSASAARAELRFAHLAAHLRTPEILTAAQIDRYRALRGYAANACENPPAGHDPSIWRRHNGCE